MYQILSFAKRAQTRSRKKQKDRTGKETPLSDKESLNPANDRCRVVFAHLDSLRKLYSGEKKWSIVVDYRELNEKATNDFDPLPNIADVLDNDGRCTYFTIFDLAKGFH